MHPDGHEFVYVVEGEQTFEVEGMGTKVVKAGEVIHRVLRKATPPRRNGFATFSTDAPRKFSMAQK
jgi:hypothetical protein